MGSPIEINDTLQLTDLQGFPSGLLDRAQHVRKPVTLADVAGRVFSFTGKPGARLFQLDPVRVYLVHNIDGKWLFWGHVFIQSQTISKKTNDDGSWSGEWQTSGTYQIAALYDPAYQEEFTRRESPPGLSYFAPVTLSQERAV